MDNLFSGIFGLIFGLFYIVSMVFVYFIPTIVAVRNKHTETTSIVIINTFLGWTGIVWLITFVWSITDTAKLNVANIAPAYQQNQVVYPAAPTTHQ